MAGPQHRTRKHTGSARPRIEPGRYRVLRDGRGAPGLRLLFRLARRTAHHLDPGGHDLQRPAFLAVPVELLVFRGIGPGIGAAGRLGDRQPAFESLVPQIQRAAHFDLLRRDALLEDLPARPFGQLQERLLQSGDRLLAVRRVDAGRRVPNDVGPADPVGAEDARVGVQKHLAHSQLPGDGAGVLPGRAAEGHQHVLPGIASLGNGDRADRLDHVGVGDAKEAVGQLVQSVAGTGGRGDLLAERLQSRLDGAAVEREGEVPGEDLALVEVHVGHGQRAAAPVAGRAGVGARAFGSHGRLHAVEAADRPAAGGHGLDGHHRGHHAHARLLGLVLQLVAPVVARDVGAGSAHVEPDGPIEPGRAGNVRKPYDTAGRPGEDAVLAHEPVGLDQPARRSQDLQARKRG